MEGISKYQPKGSSNYYVLKKHKLWFDEEGSTVTDKGNKLKCSGYRMQVK
jgi:hypothetical protein